MALLALSGWLMHGCAEKQVRARVWYPAIYVKPAIPAVARGSADDAELLAPDLRWDVLPPPSGLIPVRQPLRPHTPSQPPAEAVDTHQPPPLSLAPQLSQQEIATAQTQLNESVAVAQKNLDAAKGRTLSSTQADLASKVVSFLQESKDAVRDGDWMRARNLARKAQVLSEELAASL